MTSYSKLPKTPQQQIQQLKDEGLIISDTLEAERFLEDIAYYRLRAYWIIFEASSNPRTFKPNIKFEDVTNLYLFDEDLRNLIFSVITRIEISLRATFSNLSVNFNSAHFYLDSNNFKRYGTHLESLYKIKRTINNNKDELFIAHYLNKYSQPELPPVWSVVETLTIGELQYWITNLKDAQLGNIARKYGFFKHEPFTSIIERLSIIRNICAHHNRLWNRKIVKKKLKQIQQNNMLKDALSQVANSEETFYGTFCYMAYMLYNIDRDSHAKLINGLKALIAMYTVNVNEMGFASNWQNLALFKSC